VPAHVKKDAVSSRSRTRGALSGLRARRGIAFHVLLAFVGGFLLLPCLHNLAHRADHEHGADGFSIRWHEDAHRQARAHTHPHAGETAAQTSVASAPDAGHGYGGAGHFGAATLAVPFFIYLPPPARMPDGPGVVVRAQAPAAVSYAIAQPRGPPAG